jgi:hypothetical protein
VRVGGLDGDDLRRRRRRSPPPRGFGQTVPRARGCWNSDLIEMTWPSDQRRRLATRIVKCLRPRTVTP